MKNVSIKFSLKVFFVVFLFLFGFADLKAQLRDIATNATDPFNLDDAEPSIAVNPINPLEIVVVTFAEGWGPGQPAPIWRSTDGGVTWAKLFILPQPNPLSNGPGDQKVSFDSMGRLHVVELAKGIPLPRCLVFRQTGAPGTNLSFGALFGDDQPHLDIDHAAMSPFLGRLYAPWLDFAPANERSTVTRSVNRGVTVTNVPAGNNTSFPNRTTRIAIARDGKAYIIYKTREGTAGAPVNFENVHFRVNRTDNGGVSWDALGGAAGVSIHGVTQMQTWFTNGWGPAGGKVSRARSSDAWIAVDPGDGDVYAAFCDRDASGFGQIFAARSTNQGATWTITRVTDGTRHSAYPEIAVTSGGAIGVLYIDFGPTPNTATTYRHRFARSTNSGATWSNSTLQSMNVDTIANATSGWLWGDYEGLTAQGNTFYGVFTGESIGRTTRQLDPIFFTRTGIIFDPCLLRPWICIEPWRMDPGILVLRCPFPDCRVIDPIPRNCLVKYDCPGCGPRGLCPPWYNVYFDGLDDIWRVQVIDPTGKIVAAPQMKTKTGIVVSFRPEKRFFENQKIGDYNFVFTMGKKGKVNEEYKISTRLEAGDKPYKP